MPHPPLSVWALIPERLASTDCLNQDPNQSQPMRGAHRHQEVIRHTSKNQGVWEELGGFSSSSPPQIVIWYWLHLPLYLLLGSTCSVTTAGSSLFLACSFNSQRAGGGFSAQPWMYQQSTASFPPAHTSQQSLHEMMQGWVHWTLTYVSYEDPASYVNSSYLNSCDHRCVVFNFLF